MNVLDRLERRLASHLQLVEELLVEVTLTGVAVQSHDHRTLVRLSDRLHEIADILAARQLGLEMLTLEAFDALGADPSELTLSRLIASVAVTGRDTEPLALLHARLRERHQELDERVIATRAELIAIVEEFDQRRDTLLLSDGPSLTYSP